MEKSSIGDDSENDYENVTSNHIVKTRNCKGPSNYQNSENVYENTPIHRGIRDSSGPAHHSDRRACIWVGVGLATVCILQLILNVYLYIVTYTTSGEDLLKITKYDNLTKERDQLQTIYKNLTKERDQLLTSYNTLAKERDQRQTSYNTLAKERDQLQTSYNNLARQMCPESWIKSGSSCYYMSTDGKSWTDSRKDCQDRGGDLIIINSREEQNFIKVFCHRFWIGLSDRDVEGTWRWVDGSPLTTSYWNTKEPNDAGGIEDCVEMRSVGGDPVRAWNDAPCKDTKHWICERPFPYENSLPKGV